MVLSIIGIIIGVMVLAAGIYYLKKEKEDRESKKIYTIAAAAGAVITAVMIIKLIFELV